MSIHSVPRTHRRPAQVHPIPSEAADSLAPAPAQIVVVGIGGAGNNAINRMIATHVHGVRFLALNTDAQALAMSQAPEQICLGETLTHGLGAGGNPEVGALVVGTVTLPFSFEGSRRRRVAQEGVAALAEILDALIMVPNDRLLQVVGRNHSLTDAFQLADDILRQGVQGMTEVITVPGLVNVDFADVRTVMQQAGLALMSIGEGRGEHRAEEAAQMAVAGGWLGASIRGAQRVLLNITGGNDMTLYEVTQIANLVREAVDEHADMIFGAVLDPAMHDQVRVTLVAAGIERSKEEQAMLAKRHRGGTDAEASERAEARVSGSLAGT